MIEILDGPAAGRTFAVRRAPLLVRLVQERALLGDGGWDVLDQIDDYPKLDENVHVYRREPSTWGIVCIRPGGRYEMGKYRHVWLPHGLRETLRQNETWRSWATGQKPDA